MNEYKGLSLLKCKESYAKNFYNPLFFGQIIRVFFLDLLLWQQWTCWRMH